MKKLSIFAVILTLVLAHAQIVVSSEKGSMAEETKSMMYNNATKYTFDKSHSTIGFAVKHLLISKTRGSFSDYSGGISFDPEDLSTFKADMTIQVSSIDTKNEGRDNHLKSADFFDAESHPTIMFKSKSLAKNGSGHLITGDLTIRGVTKEISIPVEIAGPVKNPFGDGMALGLTGSATINRQDFGVSWNKDLDNGGVVVDDMVDLVIEIEAHSKS